MVITKHFVFLHMPKTGGMFMQQLCAASFSSELITHSLHLHAPFEEIPEAYRALPIFYVVRDPWDWYGSWYEHHHHRRRGPQHEAMLDEKPFWRTAFESGKADFKQTVVNACTGRVAHALMPLDSRLDYYSARFRWIGGRGLASGQVEVGKFETFVDDFTAFLTRHGVPTSPALASGLAEWDSPQTREIGRYRHYYDMETRNLVASKAQAIIAKYGYEF